MIPKLQKAMTLPKGLTAGRPTWRCSTSTVRAASNFAQGTEGPAET